MTTDPNPAIPVKRKLSHVSVPAEVADLVKLAAHFLGIPRAEIIIRGVRMYLRAANFQERVSTAVNPDSWENGDVDKPRNWSKRSA